MADDERASGRRKPMSRSRRAIAFALLALGVSYGVTHVLPAVPRQRAVELALADASSVVDVDVAWTHAGARDALRGGSWHFAAGTAPSAIATSVDLPDGSYDLDVTLRRVAGGIESFHRTISLADTSAIRVPLR